MTEKTIHEESNQPRRRAGLRFFLLRVLLSLFSILFTLGLLELSLWLFGINPPSRETGLIPHPIWHHWHPTNYQFEYYVAAEGFRKTLSYNEHGMRDSRAISVAKPPGTFRIAMVGDSYVEAQQVEETEGIVRQLENRLQPKIRQTQRRLEVINFGCGGLSTSLEMLLLREWALKFNPDLVILVHYFNDISDDSQFGQKAHFQAGQLVAVSKPGQGKSGRIRVVLRRSRLFRLVEGALHARRQRRQPRPNPADSLLVSWDAIMHDPIGINLRKKRAVVTTGSRSVMLKFAENLSNKGASR